MQLLLEITARRTVLAYIAGNILSRWNLTLNKNISQQRYAKHATLKINVITILVTNKIFSVSILKTNFNTKSGMSYKSRIIATMQWFTAKAMQQLKQLEKM